MIPPQTRPQADHALQKWSDDDPGHDVQGPGHGKHTKRTLASLSMEGKVCVVTGAGRGLGNMMARTFVESYVYFCFFIRIVLIIRGASAIVLVDLNKADAEAAAKDLTDWFGKSAFSYRAIGS
jgi:D-arabinitol 2-dehydrogenase